MARARVLFVCTTNSCRSHMEEWWLRRLAGDRLEPLSTGSRPAGFVHPLAVRAMAEAGMGISGHSSKSLDEFTEREVGLRVTVCDTYLWFQLEVLRESAAGFGLSDSEIAAAMRHTRTVPACKRSTTSADPDPLRLHGKAGPIVQSLFG